MKTNRSEIITFAAFIIITAIGYLLWVLGIFFIWLICRAVGISTSLWAMIEALSTAVAAAAVLSAGFIAYRELSEIANSRYMEAADRLFDELNSAENIAARRWVFQHLPEDPEAGIKNITPEGQAAIKQVLNSLDRVAFMTQAGWIPDEMIMPWMHPMIAKSWDRLGPYVNFEKARRNEPYYYEHASQLAERCRAWRAKNSIDPQMIWIDDAL